MPVVSELRIDLSFRRFVPKLKARALVKAIDPFAIDRPSLLLDQNRDPP